MSTFIPRTLSPQFEELPLMDDEKSLLRGCLETPWDKAPFLVYADWIEEHNETERANYLRSALETEKIKKITQIPNPVLDWFARFIPRPHSSWLFFRGFPSHFKIKHLASRDLNSLSGRWHTLPWDWCFSFRATHRLHAETVVQMVNHPRMLNLTRFEATRHFDSDQLRAFARSPFFNNLTRLDLSENRFSVDTLAAILNNPTLINLTHLSLNACFLVRDHALLLPSTSCWKGLEALSLCHNHLDSSAIYHLATHSQAGNLRILDLTGNNVTEVGALMLSTNPFFSQLQSLDLSMTNISPEGLIALANSPNLSQLTHLNISFNPINNQVLIALSESPYLGQLKYLNVHTTTGSLEKGAVALAHSSQLKNLRKLEINRRLIGRKGREALIQKKLLRRSKRDPE